MAVSGVVIGLCIVARSDVVIVMTRFFFESAKLDESVAHDIGVGREATLYAFDYISCYAVVILLLKVDDVEVKSILLGRKSRKFDVFFGRA